MKHTLKSFTLSLVTLMTVSFMTAPAFARTITVYGSGSESGYCSGDQGYFCIHTLKERAERSGIQQAEWSCTTQQGRSLRYTANCPAYCSPNMVPPGSTTWVRCDTNCSMQCEVN